MSRPGFNINADGRFIKSDDPASSHMLVSKTEAEKTFTDYP